jgi:hypothetical protein
MNPPRTAPPICLICKLPLGPEETKTWHYACEECVECGQPLHNSNKLIWDCLNSGIPVADITCRNKLKIREIREKIFPVTLEHLRAFNAQILSIKHEVNPQEEDLKQLYDVLHELQDAASSISILLSLTKDKIRIESNVEYTEKVKTERRQSSEAAAIDENKKAIRQAERENPILRDRRKAIEGIMKTFGFSLEAATAMLNAQTSPKVQ